MPSQRVTVTNEFPKAEQPTVSAVTFALDPRERGGPSGVAVVCIDARYASVQWRGEDRPMRLHMTPADWRVVMTAIASVAPGAAVEESSTLARVVTNRRALLRCTAVTSLQADPWALAGLLDGRLGQAIHQEQNHAKQDRHQ